MNTTLEQQLICARPDHAAGNQAFVNGVMEHLPRRPRAILPRLTWLRQRPAMVVLLAVLGALLLGGGAYAAYRLWQQPKAHVSAPHLNSFGRVEAGLATQDCPGVSPQTSLELKRGSADRAAQLTGIAQARCELQAITSWANQKWPIHENQRQVLVSTLGSINSVSSKAITARSPEGDTRTVQLDKDTIFVNEQAQTTSVGAFSVGDVTAVVELDSYGPQMGAPTSRQTLAVVRLSLPPAYYGENAQNSVVDRLPCTGNPEDSCISGGAQASIDVWPRGSEAPSQTPQDGSHRSYQIQGRLIGHSGTQLQIRGSSGKVYRFTFATDIIANFNTNYAANYQGVTIAIGDLLDLHYTQLPGQDHAVIQPHEASFVSLLLDQNGKQAPMHKY